MWKCRGRHSELKGLRGGSERLHVWIVVMGPNRPNPKERFESIPSQLHQGLRSWLKSHKVAWLLDKLRDFLTGCMHFLIGCVISWYVSRKKNQVDAYESEPFFLSQNFPINLNLWNLSHDSWFGPIANDSHGFGLKRGTFCSNSPRVACENGIKFLYVWTSNPHDSWQINLHFLQTL